MGEVEGGEFGSCQSLVEDERGVDGFLMLL
jgi:hypothetical protein